ncbi:MAG TPA: hypothetical protein VFF81_05065 [Noviherbaspirillum sp.]|nr:hypothetical protein [Noviherbaspirillum sp.]
MNRLLAIFPILLTLAACAGLLLHGPITQPLQYHEFADQSLLLGMPHAADVISNIGFALVALWGWVRLHPYSGHAAIVQGWPGYRLFLVGLMLTAAGSGFYHLAPDNWRLIWDRLPIALACAGLLVAVRAETKRAKNAEAEAVWFGLFAIASVAWWVVTNDLRPYLLLQFLPIVLIPLWQLAASSARRDRIAFGIALLLYIVAKAAELHDHQLLAALGVASGHTLKHLLATLAAGVLVGRLVRRVRESRMPALRSAFFPKAKAGCQSVDLA